MHQIKPGEIGMGINRSTHYTFREATAHDDLPVATYYKYLKIAAWQGKIILFVDPLLRYLPPFQHKIAVNYVVLHGNDMRPLNLILSRFSFGTLVINTHLNRKMAQLVTIAKAQNFSIHVLDTDGAFVATW